jgi:hypothetical protein
MEIIAVGTGAIDVVQEVATYPIGAYNLLPLSVDTSVLARAKY